MLPNDEHALLSCMLSTVLCRWTALSCTYHGRKQHSADNSDAVRIAVPAKLHSFSACRLLSPKMTAQFQQKAGRRTRQTSYVLSSSSRLSVTISAVAFCSCSFSALSASFAAGFFLGGMGTVLLLYQSLVLDVVSKSAYSRGMDYIIRLILCSYTWVWVVVSSATCIAEPVVPNCTATEPLAKLACMQ